MTVHYLSFGLPDALWFTLSAGLILAHNFWLIGKGGRRAAEERLRLEAHTGHHFPAGESAIAPERIADFRLITPQRVTPITACRVDGVALVAEVVAADAGTCLAVLTLHPRPITLAADKFAGYLEDEGATATTPDFQPGVTAAQHEIYSKYAKAILAAGDDDLACRAVGQRMEIMPERNPATLRGGGRLAVRVLFDGEPLAGARVSSGSDRSGHGGYSAQARTGAEGRAEIELKAGGYWFVRSHFIRRHPDPTLAGWESFWPSLTFRVDD